MKTKPTFSKAPPPPATADDFVGGAVVGAIGALPKQEQQPAASDEVYKTLTLRLNKQRYTALKLRSLADDAPIQQLLTDAVDQLLAAPKETH